jgi:hypothetical protein
MTKNTRRSAIASGLTAIAATGVASMRSAVAQPLPGHPIVLYCDLKVDAKREKEMLDHFHHKFKPAGAKFKGFIDLKMLKLRTLIQGEKLPTGVNYRFQLTYQNEELRQLWVNSKTHAQLWPGIQDTLTDKNFQVLLFDDV